MRQLQPYHPKPSPVRQLSALINDETWPEIVQALRLTPRQADVVRLVLQAKKDKQIATELGLGLSTVRMHLRYIYGHLDVTDRMELALQVFNVALQISSHVGGKSVPQK